MSELNKKFKSLNDKNLKSIDISKVKTWLPLDSIKASHGNMSSAKGNVRNMELNKKCRKKRSEASRSDCNPYPLEMEKRKNPDYLNYIRTQKSPSEQKAIARERELQAAIKQQTRNFISLDHPRRSFNYDLDEILHVPSPNIDGDLRPKPASQSPSQILPYIQSKTLIELQAPRTGISLQKTAPCTIEDKPEPISYDPRQLQTELDALDDKFYVYDKKGNWYAIPASSRRRKSSLKPVKKLIVKKLSTIPTQNTCNICAVKPKYCKTLANIKLDLGFPVGIEVGSFGIYDQKFSENVQGKQGFACCLIAFGLTYVKPERKWDVKALDNIIIDGTALFERSLDENGKSNEFLMKDFQIGDVRIEVEHGLPSVQGELRAKDTCCLDIYGGLKKCIKKGKFMVFRCRKITLLIWKKYGYFVYDPIGRTKDCLSGTQSALITVKNIENIAHIIVNLSNLKGNPTYTLTKIKITKLESPTKQTIKSSPVTNPNPGYNSINSYRAILRCPYHLRHMSFKERSNTQSMPMSITSLIYSKIDPPSTWSDRSLHKIMLIGDELCKNWSDNQKEPLSLKDLPKNFQFGQYGVSLKLIPFYSNAMINEKDKESQVLDVLKETLKDNHRLLLQVCNMFFAVWIKNQIYYLFDPYPRNEEGDVCIDKFGQCCINMFSFVEELCQMFRRNMLQIVPNDKMYVHVIEIEELSKLSVDEQMITSKPIIQIMEDDTDERNDEVKSLIESLDFEIKSTDAQVSHIKNEDRILILDSPSASVTIIQDECGINEVPNKESLKDKNVLPQTKSKKFISPSVDYLCAAETFKFIDNLTDNLPIERTCHKKSETIQSHPEICSNASHLTATKILLKSDLQNLKDERERIKREPVSLPHEQCPCRDPPLSLSQEILIPSNFKQMPDGSEIIFGTKNVLSVRDDITPESLEYICPIVAISTVVSSYKYSIATWNSNIVDFVLDMSKEMILMLEKNETTRTNFFSIANHNFPLLEIGSKKYEVRMEMVETCIFKSLRNTLEKLFPKVQKLVILSPASSIAIFKRKNFYYFYEPYPCNLVGLRADNGFACFIRFKSLSRMICRLEANHKEIGLDDIVIVSQIILKEISNESPYPCPTKSQEEALIKNAKLEQVYRDYKKQQQLDEINELIEKEYERIKKFRNLKPSDMNTSEISAHISVLETLRNSIEQSLSNNDKELELKQHQSKINRKYRALKTYKIPPLNPKPITGYKQRDEDLLWKIQGSTALQNRCSNEINRVKQCHFSSLYALLFAMHHPIEKWNHRKVDLCIENGISLYDKIPSPENSLTRAIENLQIENMLYNILISSCDTHFKSQTTPLRKSLTMNFQRLNYLILQFPNCSFGLYKDQLYHVFDPYPSVEYYEPLSKVETEDLESRKKKIVDTLTREENKASWILCISIDDALDYISKRVDRQKMKSNYLLYRINIVSYKKAPADTKISYLLYKSRGNNADLDMICGYNVEPRLPSEEIEFLDKVGTPPWSRLESVNVEKNKRGTPQTSWKEYHIEISNELYSLWGDISPNSLFFKENAGKQYLAINVIAIAMSLLYPLDEWNAEILNSIVIHGDRYFSECIETAPQSLQDFEFSHLNSEYELDHMPLRFIFNLIVYGVLYDSDPHNFNLSRALTYFFRNHSYGILSIFGRAVAIGREKTYFMFDCQSTGSPLFMKNQGAAYVLRCCTLRRLLECILLTLNIDRYCVRFVIHAVEVHIGDEDGSVASDNEEEDGDNESKNNVNREKNQLEENATSDTSDVNISNANQTEKTNDNESEVQDEEPLNEQEQEDDGPKWISGESVKEFDDLEKEKPRLSRPYAPMIDPRI